MLIFAAAAFIFLFMFVVQAVFCSIVGTVVYRKDLTMWIRRQCNVYFSDMY